MMREIGENVGSERRSENKLEGGREGEKEIKIGCISGERFLCF